MTRYARTAGGILPALILISASAMAGEPTAERQQELQKSLQQNCTVCHGPSFEGSIGPALTAKALAAKDEQMLVTTIMDGRPGTAMTPWGMMFKENEIRWMVKFLRNGGK